MAGDANGKVCRYKIWRENLGTMYIIDLFPKSTGEITEELG